MKKILLCSIVSILVWSCSTSKIVSTWSAPSTSSQVYSKILVLGLIRDVDRSIQERMENHMVSDLHDHGYTAYSSLKEYGPKAFEKMTEEEAVRTLTENQIDAIISIVLLDKQKERGYVPGHIFNSPYYSQYYYLGGYWGVMYKRIYEPDYYIYSTKYFWESNLWDVKTKKLIYSVQTESFDPGSSEKLGHEYSLLIVKDLIKQNVLKAHTQNLKTSISKR